ncbi:hypothetical protein D3C77_724640 [compost metagenome]
MFVARALAVATVDFYYRQHLASLAHWSAGDPCLLLVIHVNAPFHGQFRYRFCDAYTYKTNERRKTAVPVEKKLESLW